MEDEIECCQDVDDAFGNLKHLLIREMELACRELWNQNLNVLQLFLLIYWLWEASCYSIILTNDPKRITETKCRSVYFENSTVLNQN